MPYYCAIPPLDMTVARIGRGNGVGWNRNRTRQDQYHAGIDFLAAPGSPIVAVVPGRVVLIGLDSRRPERNGLNGYGNCVVVQADYSLPAPADPLPGETSPPRRGLSGPFYMLYAHMQSPPVVEVGQRVSAGTLLGYVGNTSNGRFAGMGAHMHFEVRIRPFPGGSYDRDTVDPDLLFASLGIDRVNTRPDAGRQSGGDLLIRQNGPSDCGGRPSELSGWLGVLAESSPKQYLDPLSKKAIYASKGVTLPPTVDVMPPEYSAVAQSSFSPVVIAAGATTLFVVGAMLLRKRRT